MLYEEKTFSRVNTQCSNNVSQTTAQNSNYVDRETIPDRVLWEAFKSGDEIAFITIYKRHYNKLYHFGCQFSEDKELVRDCLQDFFIYLRKNKAGFGETNCIGLYLFKSFKRRVIDYLKKNNVEFHSNEQFAFTQLSVEASSESNYINHQVRTEQAEKLNKALNALDSKEREAIYYFYYQGLSYEKVAEILKFSHVSSARRVMYRGLRHLRDFF